MQSMPSLRPVKLNGVNHFCMCSSVRVDVTKIFSIAYPAALVAIQPSQPLPCIIHLGYTRVSVLPEGRNLTPVYHCGF